MDSLLDAVQSVLSQPTPDALVVLQAVLLARGEQGARVGRALEIAGHFHSYLSELQSKLTARQYSELASMLDIGAVGIVVLENLLCAGREEVWKRLALGGLAEGLMVAASRQYVKGWQTETGLTGVTRRANSNTTDSPAASSRARSRLATAPASSGLRSMLPGNWPKTWASKSNSCPPNGPASSRLC